MIDTSNIVAEHAAATTSLEKAQVEHKLISAIRADRGRCDRKLELEEVKRTLGVSTRAVRTHSVMLAYLDESDPTWASLDAGNMTMAAAERAAGLRRVVGVKRKTFPKAKTPVVSRHVENLDAGVSFLIGSMINSMFGDSVPPDVRVRVLELKSGVRECVRRFVRGVTAASRTAPVGDSAVLAVTQAFETLEIDVPEDLRGFDLVEFKKASRRILGMFHPDRGATDEERQNLKDRFNEVKICIDTIVDYRENAIQ